MRQRKPRSDRKHVVYELRVATLSYIGVTRFKRTARFAARERFLKHVNRALGEARNWALCKAIRKHGPDAFEIIVVNVIRGKAEAHKFERQLIYKKKPKLNTDLRGS
jgi:hypothetical protein